MRKILVIVLLVVMVIGLVGCASTTSNTGAAGSLPEIKDDVSQNPDPGQLDNIPIDTTDVTP